MTIWKYTIAQAGPSAVLMPKGATVLSVGVQNGTPVVWALVDPASPQSNRHFYTALTGASIPRPEEWRFVGTFQIDWFVGHLFEAA